MNILQKLFTRRSSRIDPAKIIIFLFFLLAGSFALSVLFGSTNASIISAANAFRDGDFSDPALRIILYVRMPRAVASVLAGSSLAVSGAIIQAVLNNSMASPNIIGVNSGAGLAVSLVVAMFPFMVEYLPLAAFCGALCSCMLIYFISIKTNSSRMSITLVGITISSILSAGINAVKTIFPDSLYNANTFMVGGFSGLSMSDISLAWRFILIGIVIAIIMGKDIDILSLGEESAASLGMNVKRIRFILLTLASVLAGSAVSFAGLLGFVGLLGPHIARRFVTENHRTLIPVSGLIGSILVTVCDLLGRVIFAPYEIPVGIIMSFVGGPFFIMLILTQRKSRVYD
ncbi:MAG: iron ABC transporter permease [Anaerofustis stercorihominis]|nr:iron ABC transporter permease [Anaerofustis stercorihominis]